MGLTPGRGPEVVQTSAGGDPWVATRLDFLVNWARANSLWPMPFGTACCAIEFMATAASKFDLARFGMERMSFSPRQADVLICAGRVPFKLAPVLRRIWQQMPQPKWCISMGACASTGGMFDNYAVVQGIDTIIPVDVYVPGCPPRPEGLMYGIMMLQKKVMSERGSDEAIRQEMEPDPQSQLYIPPSALVAGASSLGLLQRARLAERRASAATAELVMRSEIEQSVSERTRPVIDHDSGLGDGRFFELILETRMATARRHLWPCAVVLLDVSPSAGETWGETLAEIGATVRRTLRECDAASRLRGGTFGVVLDDTDEAGAVWAAERLQAAVEASGLRPRRLAAGVACYPAHGLTSGEVLDQAQEALARACAASNAIGAGRVEVAHVDLR
jgi:NADH-quinone oxidoreductase subunit B